MKIYSNVDEYIDSSEPEVHDRLNELRSLIKEIAPNAQEGISYGMPGYKLNKKPFVYFANQKNHIGFYPTPSVVEHFRDKLKDYKTSKGAIQFPKKSPIPYSLIREMVMYRAEELQK